jgi:predicted NBD/HSP70 family sugar kinase
VGKAVRGKVLVGIDLGGTNLKVGLVSPDGLLIAEKRAPTGPRKELKDG